MTLQAFEDDARRELTLVEFSSLLPEGEGEGSWQERALCAQTDPEAFFPEKGGSTREAKRCACRVKSAPSAWSTRLRTTSGLASGAACLSANVAS